jgi:3-oxoacyl-[acyl-carrier protein] reductase
MRIIPDRIEPCTIGLQVSERMVHAFADLTGDCSALHLSESFARRSAYRRPVAHGMLPLGFIALLDCFRIGGLRCIPVALTGQFSAPVFAGDRLTLACAPSGVRGAAGGVDFSYRILNDASGTLVTQGTVTVVYERSPAATASAASHRGARMVSRPPELQDARLEEITKGQTDGFDFRVSGETLRDFAELLAEGAGRGRVPEAMQWRGQFCLPNLLSILLVSTSVGVCLPGAHATFLQFSAECADELELGVLYRLQAEVTQVSRSTRIVKKSVTIAEARRDAAVLIRGKAAALVNKPSPTMPTISDLKASALDPGLKGKVVLVTGASRGIGETTAKLFALLGAIVVVNYHRGAEDASRIVDEIRAEGGDAIAVAADVTSAEAVESLIRTAMERYGAIHVLVNNAARDYRPIPFLRLTWDEIQEDLEVIAKGAFLCCQKVIPHMIERGGGKIVSISSVAVDNPPADQAKYVMAKSALVGLTRSLSIEFAARNIQVNLVVPNFVDTDLVAHVPEGFRGQIARETPMQRLASPADVAQAVVFLASSFSSFTTGQKIMVTGGGAPYL